MSHGSSRTETQARRLLRAYPWRVRTEQAEEIVSTILDTLPPSARRIPWRDRFDLVRGGLRIRRAHAPNWAQRLRYTWTGQISPRYVGWLADDIGRPGHRRRAIARSVAMGCVSYVPLLLLSGASLPAVLCLVAACAVPRGTAGNRYEAAIQAGLVPDTWWMRPRPYLPRWELGRLAGALALGALASGWVLWLSGPEDFGSIRLDWAARSAVVEVPYLAPPSLIAGGIAGVVIGFAFLVAVARSPARSGGPRAAAAPWRYAAGLAFAPPIAAAAAVHSGQADMATVIGLFMVPLGLAAGAIASASAIAGIVGWRWPPVARRRSVSRRSEGDLTLWDLVPGLAWRRPTLAIDPAAVHATAAPVGPRHGVG